MFIDATVRSSRANDRAARTMNVAQTTATRRLANPELAVFEPVRDSVIRAVSLGTMRSCAAAKRYTMEFGPDGGIQAYEVMEVI